MITQKSGAGEILKQLFEAKRRRHPRYSLRAFSSEIGINVATLSRVFAGRETLSSAQAAKVLAHPLVDAETKERLVGAFFPNRTTSARSASAKREPHFAGVHLEPFDLEWLDLALLDLLNVKGMDHSIHALAKALAVGPKRVVDAIEKLEARKLVKLEGERYRKQHPRLYLTADSASMAAIRRFHRGLIERGLAELAKTSEADVSGRLINSYVVSSSPERFRSAKKKVEAFQKRLIEFLSDGEATQVYALGTLFFPVTPDLRR